MTLSEKIQDAISSIQLTGNSGRKYDNLIPLLTELTAVPGDDIHVTAADKVSNAGGRLLNGKHKTSGRHYRLCVLIISAQNADGVVEKAKNHIDDRFQGYFDTIAIVNHASNSTQWVFSYVVTNKVDNVADKIKSVYADAVVVEASNVVSGHEPSSSNESSASYSDLGSLVNSFKTSVLAAGLQYDLTFLRRFVAALLAKPFVILTGLSGSGKTKLAEAFAAWLGEPFEEDGPPKGDARPENDVEESVVSATPPGTGISGGRYLLVSVGADWTNNEHLLGYPNALEEGKYVMPDTGVLAFLLDAAAHSKAPYFLILDEMNLSHVERYFADFLSAMESNKRTIRLHGGKEPLNKGEPHEVPPTLALPQNLFVIGTMNVDETTYMFSPKVLDRAQVLEFRVSETEMSAFLANPPELKFDLLEGKGAALAAEFREVAQDGSHGVLAQSDAEAVQTALNAFFPPLAELGAEFGYRSATEILRFVALYREAGAATVEEAIDAGVVQKLLPKLHGSQSRLNKVLETLAGLACVKRTVTDEESGEEKEESVPLYPLALDKIERMRKRLNANGFASFAEA